MHEADGSRSDTIGGGAVATFAPRGQPCGRECPELLPVLGQRTSHLRPKQLAQYQAGTSGTDGVLVASRRGPACCDPCAKASDAPSHLRRAEVERLDRDPARQAVASERAEPC